MSFVFYHKGNAIHHAGWYLDTPSSRIKLDNTTQALVSSLYRKGIKQVAIPGHSLCKVL
jgi:hypothetical protein